MIRIIFTGGGTGGHLFPLVAVSRKMAELCRAKNLGEPKFYYFGPESFLKESLKKENLNFRYSILISGKWRRYFSLKNFIDFFKIIAGAVQALFKVWAVMPDAIFSKGGYGSIGTVFAGWLYRIPIIVHESDSVPGLANRLAAPFATFIAVSFNEAAEYFAAGKTYFIGEAVRDSFFTPANSQKERPLLNLKTKKPLIFVIGGSQGAQKINDIILDTLPDLVKISEIIHQTGNANYEQVAAESKVVFKNLPAENSESYNPVKFLTEPEFVAAMHSADLIISRSGAGSIFEIAAAGKASILIPITDSPGDHNRRNAYIFADGGRCEVVEESNLTPNLLFAVISSILSDPEKKKNMEEKARKFATPKAAELIAEALINLTL